MMAYFSIMEHYFNLTASPHVYNVVKQRAKLLFGTAAPAAAEKKRVGLSRPRLPGKTMQWYPADEVSKGDS